MAGKFEIKKTKTGWNFDLKSGNGEVILTSQVYSTEASCKAGIASIQINAPLAAVEDQTGEGYELEKNPKFEIYIDNGGEFRFRIQARNGEIIGVSAGYTTKANCKNGIESVIKNAPDAVIVEI
jgi:uncharacterized protein YegP (UPF0339 family)